MSGVRRFKRPRDSSCDPGAPSQTRLGLGRWAKGVEKMEGSWRGGSLVGDMMDEEEDRGQVGTWTWSCNFTKQSKFQLLFKCPG